MQAASPSPTLPSPTVGSSVHLLGTIITFRATAGQTEGHFSLVDTTTASGAGTPAHVHSDDAEAFYVLEGSYEFVVNGKAGIHGPGSFVYMPQGCPHAFRNVGAAPARMLTINVPGGLHERFFLAAGDPVSAPDAFPASAAPDLPKIIAAATAHGISMLPPS